MKRLFIITVILLIFTNNATALQVGDGQYDKTYNDLDLAATQSRFNNITTKGAGGGVPVGSIIAWPVASNPEDMENWLECNGQAVNAAMYPELRAVIGANVPDLRGVFLRGYGSQTYSQNNGSMVGVTSTTHSSGALGQIQGDAIRNITGGFAGRATGMGGAFFYKNVSDMYDYGGGYLYNLGFDASRIVPTAEENRPVNVAVRYLIRALP